jgi:hypothetical protein
MKIDLYTKGILTVIALSLVVMAFKDVDPISKAFAHGGDVVHKIAICDKDAIKCAQVYNDSLRIFR